ncbi:nonribosomal peptide synthase [Aspergillus brasiliensis]|nr:nonribosomal peptide synthase [Aspergillus brasiliensis]
METIDSAILAQICQDCHISVAEVEDVYACTPFQAGLLADRADYIQRNIHSLDSTLDLDRFCASLHRVVASNQILRTRIVDCPLGLVQVVVKREACTDCLSRPVNQDVEQYLRQDELSPMHLGTPLARFAIVGRKLVTTIHHAIADSYSLLYLYEDACKIYQGESPPPRAPFREFVDYCKSIDSKSAAAFWKCQFSESAPGIFPTVPSGHVMKASQTAAHSIALTKKPPLPLLPAYIEAAWAMTAADYTGSENVVFGYVMSGRTAIGGVETTLGPTISTVPMQVQLNASSTIEQLLKSRTQYRRSLLTSPFLQYGLANIRHTVSNEAHLASGFQTLLDILSVDEEKANVPGLTFERTIQTYVYGLSLVCKLAGDDILVRAAFDSIVLPEAQVHRILRQMEHRLKALIRSPPSTELRQLSPLNFSDTTEILDWNSHVPEAVNQCLHDIFTSQASRRPDAAAVDAWDGQATYHELDVMSDNLAHELLLRKISPEEPIPFTLERSLSAVVAVLGIMKAGGACVPIELSFPKARKHTIMRIVGARLIVTSSTLEAVEGCESIILDLRRVTDGGIDIRGRINRDPVRAAYILFTSGSSGEPKGVVLEHRSLATSYTAICGRVGWSSGTRVLQFSSPSWDVFALEVMGPLIVGGCICIPSSISRESALGEYINSARVDSAVQTPTALRNLTPEDMLPGLKSLLVGGEPVPEDAYKTWGSKVRLYNNWGPCETSTTSTIADLSPLSVYPTSIGTPVGSAVWIVDRDAPNKLLPIGAVGEMLVEGPGVARGYHNNPTQTASSFISPPPFIPKRPNTSSPKVYRTGDLARYNSDGSIAFVGRRDNQIKLRGQRFEVEDVEQVLGRHGCTCAVAVTNFKFPRQEREDLVAFVTLSAVPSCHPSPESADDELPAVPLNEDRRNQLQTLHDFTRDQLPPYMVPTAWVVVTHLPKLRSTKIDRVKLRQWLHEVDLSSAGDIMRQFGAGRRTHGLTPPASPPERALQLAWSSVLGVEEDHIGRESSFLSLGGDSITAMQAASRCHKQGFSIASTALLRAGTLAEAASEIKEPSEASAPSSTPTSRDLPLQKSNHDHRLQDHLHPTNLCVPRENVEAIYPCTPLQEGLLLARMKRNGDERAYNSRFAFRLATRCETKVDITRISNAWKALCAAHPILRTIFIPGLSQNGASQQIVLKDSAPSISIYRVQANCSDTTELFKHQQRLPFAHTQPPHRLSLYEGVGKAVYAILEISHAIYDARTLRIILANIAAGYSSCRAIKKGRSFSDYVAWMQEREEVGRQYWKTYLAGAQPCILPRDSAMEETSSSVRGLEVPCQNAPGLLAFCRSQGVTIAHFIQAAWGVVLRLYTGLSSVYFGCGRSDQDSLDGGEDILGPLITMMVCKFSFEDRSVSGLRLLQIAREDAARGMEQPGCSLARLHDDLGLSNSPLFDTIMTVGHAWPADLAPGEGDLMIEHTDSEGATEYSIFITVNYSQDSVNVHLSYQRARLTDSLVECIARTFARVIANIIASPEEPVLQALQPERPKSCPTLSRADMSLLQRWNTQAPAAFKECFPQRAREVARQRPLAPAVCSWDRNLDYGQLDLLSDYLARKIIARYGIGAEAVVPFACEKAASAIVILLAISKAGAAFLPLDITHPPERLATVVADSGASLIIVNTPALRDRMAACTRQSIFLARLDHLVEETSVEQTLKVRNDLESVTIEPSNAAYAIYTSGSTGRPKGVVVEHGNLAIGAGEHARRIGMTARSRVLQLASLAFDMGIGDVVYALCCGACLCVPSESDRMGDIAGAINRLHANFLFTTPTQLSALAPEEVPTLRTVSVGGEPIGRQTIVSWKPHVRLINSYGPVESTIIVSCRDVTIGDQDGRDIGYPSRCRFWVVDPDNHDLLVPIGTQGELVIEGPVVARGYLHNFDATASAFINPPAWSNAQEFASLNLASQRFYKTGDLVIQAGEKSFLIEGRKDAQVKLRGQRVELGEIEYHLSHRAEPGWHWAVDIIQPRDGEDPCLAAFFATDKSTIMEAPTPARGLELLEPLAGHTSAAKETLKHVVPAYMVPEYFIRLRALPMLSSFKTDRKFLRTMAAGLSRAGLLAYRVRESVSNIGDAHSSPVKARKDATDDQAFMQQAWADVLGISSDEIGSGDNFFDIGGNSVRAIRLIARLRKAGHELSVEGVFRAPTLAHMVSKTSLSEAQSGDQPKSTPTAALDTESIPHLMHLAERFPWLHRDNIESVAPATDTQAWMLDVSERAGRGFDNGLTLTPLPGHALSHPKLQRACQEVLRQHPILRTVFVCCESQLLQVALRKPPIEQVHTDKRRPKLIPSSILNRLPTFHLTSGRDSTSCQKLELRIHHALYDAISLGHLLDDVGAAYKGRDLVTRPTQYHEWISHVKAKETTGTYVFWRELLRGSMPRSLVSGRSNLSAPGNPADSKLCFKTRASGIPVSYGTDASVFNAAWSLVLSRVLEEQDVVFGYISANRSSALPGVDQIVGPCINILPVHACCNGDITTASLVAELQRQSTDSIPHQHVGLLSIMKNSPDWPKGTLNSLVAFQNHESLDDIVRLGDVDCVLSANGRVGNSAEVCLGIEPQPDGQVGITLQYSSESMPHEKALWMGAYLDAALHAFPTHWTKTIDQLRHHIDAICNFPIRSERGAILHNNAGTGRFIIEAAS